MNIKTIIFGSLALALAIGGTFLKMTSQDTQSVYTPRAAIAAYGNAGHAEYMHMMRADPATGEINYALVNQVRNEMLTRKKQKRNNKAPIGINWTQMGPDNVGGRTRAILVDQSNPNVVYAGSVAGGLFVSTDATGTWNQVAGHEGTLGENLMISSLTQTASGRIFFGTGSHYEGGTGPYPGNGIYEYVPASGAILPVLVNATSLPNNNPSDQLSKINVIKSVGERLYFGGRNTVGFRWADPVAGIYPTTLAGWTNPILDQFGNPDNAMVSDFDIGSDGAFIVCLDGSKVCRSNSDAVGSFTIDNIGASRFNVAIAPSNPNVYYLLRSAGTLVSLDISLDKGATWNVIVPGGSPCIDPFAQNDCSGGQAGYDACIAVNPADWGHILVGGVQLYEWKLNPGSNPIGGSWLKAAVLSPQSVFNPFYVHADKHIILWPNANTIYIGGDGGINRSTDGGQTYQQRNLGYNVTTFYDIAIAANGWFMGGAQDNGTQMFTYGATGEVTPLGATEIQGGDGFDCSFSNQGPGIAYATSQNGSLNRYLSGGAGGNFFDNELNGIVYPGPANDPTAGNGQPFHTVIENWENDRDPLSIDTITLYFDSLGTHDYTTLGDSVFAGDTIFAGTSLYYESLSNSTVLEYIVPSNIILDYPMDSVKIVDPIQNKFAFATTAGVFLTRDGARLNALSPEWHKVANTTSVSCMEFSADGNHLFIGTYFGQVWRVSNLSMGNTDSTLDIRNSIVTRVTTVTAVGNFSGAVVTGIAADPNDSENLIVTTGGYTNSNHIFRAENAVSSPGLATFVSIAGVSSPIPKMPIYDAAIDYNDKNRVVIGTEWGVWSSVNAFGPMGSVVWEDESANGMTHVPVLTVDQQTLRSNASVNSGYLYLGTYGRGFYMSDDLATSIEENDDFADSKEKEGFVSNLKVYPNPLNNVGMIEFDLNENSNTTINVYSLTGKLVKTMKLGVKTKGNHKVKLDASNLSIGSYILSLESDSERSVAKFIVTR